MRSNVAYYVTGKESAALRRLHSISAGRTISAITHILANRSAENRMALAFNLDPAQILEGLILFREDGTEFVYVGAHGSTASVFCPRSEHISSVLVRFGKDFTDCGLYSHDQFNELRKIRAKTRPLQYVSNFETNIMLFKYGEQIKRESTALPQCDWENVTQTVRSALARVLGLRLESVRHGLLMKDQHGDQLVFLGMVQGRLIFCPRGTSSFQPFVLDAANVSMLYSMDIHPVFGENETIEVDLVQLASILDIDSGAADVRDLIHKELARLYSIPHRDIVPVRDNSGE